MIRRALAATVAVAALLFSVSACAGDTGELSASAAKVLRPAVQDVREAAATGTYAELRQAVQRLKDLVAQQEQSGDVSSQRAVAIENAADVLLQDARPSPSPTPSATSASPTPSQTKSPLVSVSTDAQSARKSPRASESPSAEPAGRR